MKNLKKPAIIFVLIIFIFPALHCAKVINSTENGTLVVINRVKQTVVIGYNVTLENTVITYKDLRIFIHDRRTKRSRRNLASLIHSLTKVGASTDDMINVLSILHRAGTLNGKLIVI